MGITNYNLGNGAGNEWCSQVLSSAGRFLPIAVLPMLFACVAVPHTERSLPVETNDAQNEAPSSSVSASERVNQEQQLVSQQLRPTLVNTPIPIATTMPVDIVDAEPRFDLSVRKLPADQFYAGLVDGTPYNIVVHPSVSGNVSLRLSSVTVPEVMAMARQVYGYDYKQIGNNFHVLATGIQSRVFKIDYLNVQRSGVSQTRVTSGQVSESNSGDEGGGNGGAAGGEDENSRLSGTVIDTVTRSDFWTEITQALQILVGDKKDRAVVVSPQTGVIVVRASSSELQQIEDYLSTTQGILQRQVILEAKIIEVELNDGFQSGVNWSSLTSRGDGSVLAGQVGGGSIFSGNGASDIAGSTGNLNPVNPNFPLGTVASAFGGAFTLSIEAFDDFTAFVEFLETQGDVRVLSSPRVATINNQKAVIKVGSDEFFVTDISSTTTASAGATVVSPEIELTPFFSGISLDVTPQISGDGRITLHVHPSVSEVVDQRKNITVFGQTQSLPLAFSTIRESDSIVSAENGQVVVIGGLMQDSSRDNRAGVPLLGKLPLVGGLFRHQQKTSKKSELVILLKPIVADSVAWNEQLRDSAGRIRRINKQLNAGGVSKAYVPIEAALTP